jgi:hypothetical protein
MMLRIPSSLCVRALAASGLATLSLVASSVTLAQFTPQIVNGAPELAEPTTAALIQGTTDAGHVVCSATLIGCDVAITTAHCFNSSVSEKNFLFFQHAGFVAIESATRHPAYVAAFPPNTPDFDVLRIEDIAFIKLSQPVTGITPSTIVALGAPPLGTPGKIVGFGRDPITAISSAGVDDNAGLKRSGTMTIEACEGTLTGEDLLCWHPADPPVPLGPPGEDVSTCEGDSGGPLFVIENSTRVVAGLTKGAVYISEGQSDLCEPPVDPFDTNVDRHRIWIGGIDGQGGMVAVTEAIPLATKSCSALDALPELVASGGDFGDCDGSSWASSGAPRTCGFSGTLDVAGSNSASLQFPVPTGTTLLRVAFNGVASAPGSVDTDYYLRASQSATTSQFDCAASGPGTVGYCEIFDPVADTWHVLVDQTLYRGEYQVTVSLFGPPLTPAVPILDSTKRMLLIGVMLSLTMLTLGKRFGRRTRSADESLERFSDSRS